MIYPIIMCGGSGTRLWPLSRKSMPKQFCDLGQSKSLFQSTVMRVERPEFANPILITSEEYRFIAAQQYREVSSRKPTMILEPSRKDTAAAITVGCQYLQKIQPNSMALVLPSDHEISDFDKFYKMIENGSLLADKGDFVTFGVVPDKPETTYGYIKISNGGRVEGFYEKPDQVTAQKMLDEGNHFWNSGIFLFKADQFLSIANEMVPEIVEYAGLALTDASFDLDFLRLESSHWEKIEPISVDYAVMEKAPNLSCVKFAGLWSDLGNWNSIKNLLGKNNNDGNLTEGKVELHNVKKSFVWSTKGAPLLGVVGVSNIVAVATPDAVLIANETNTESIKGLVEQLRLKGKSEAEYHQIEFRPWGWFETLINSGQYKVKRIFVDPGGVLSLQSHQHRSEHWVVTEGIATVEIEGKVFDLSENESTFIHQGAKHRLSNNTYEPLVIIEVQTGKYLEEDDIIRYEDIYKR